MRGISLGAIAATGALLAAAPANAHTTELLGDISATGGVTVTWHGDPARRCAAAGLCGYSGSAGLQPVAIGQRRRQRDDRIERDADGDDR